MTENFGMINPFGTYEDRLLQLSSLNLLYAKKKMRELRLARIKAMVDEDKPETAYRSIGEGILLAEFRLIDEVDAEIQAVMANVEVIATEFSEDLRSNVSSVVTETLKNISEEELT